MLTKVPLNSWVYQTLCFADTPRTPPGKEVRQAPNHLLSVSYLLTLCTQQDPTRKIVLGLPGESSNPWRRV